MNNAKSGRPVDISGIDIESIEVWMNSNKQNRKVIICQSILALNRNVPMNEVCRVLGVTREGVRLWKEQLRKGGLTDLLKEKKVGKRSRLNESRKSELKSIVKRSPKSQGYKTKKWTGALLQDLVSKKWGLTVSLRTAQLWLSKVR